jgi:putative redox protein
LFAEKARRARLESVLEFGKINAKTRSTKGKNKKDNPKEHIMTRAENVYKATIQYAGDEFFIGTSPSGHAQAIDTKGERKSAPTPMEMLLVSVGACTAVDVVSILEKKRQTIINYRVEVTGERRDEMPRAFTKFHIHHIVYGRDVSARAVEQAIELSDTKYCSVAATVRPQAEITTSYEIIES